MYQVTNNKNQKQQLGAAETDCHTSESEWVGWGAGVQNKKFNLAFLELHT